jgi:pimeloyl-ACP methyl ester carboxylesterase
MLPLAVEYEKRGYRVYCLDLPGHGDSSWPGEMSFDDLAVWLDGFIKMVGAPDVLVSNSFSSAVVYSYIQHGFLSEKTHVILGCPTPDTSRIAYGLYRLGNILPIETGWYLYTTWVANGIRTTMAAKKLRRQSIRWLVESEKRKRPTLHPHAGILLSNLLFNDNRTKESIFPRKFSNA